MGSSVVAPQGDISITAPVVEIGAVMDTAESRQPFEAKQSGLTLAVMITIRPPDFRTAVHHKAPFKMTNF